MVFGHSTFPSSILNAADKFDPFCSKQKLFLISNFIEADLLWLIGPLNRNKNVGFFR